MLERFLANFRQDGPPDAALHRSVSSAAEILPALGGCSFNDGLYRVHTPAQAADWTAIVTAIYAGCAGLIECFASDWLGRQFALDRSRMIRGVPQILLFQVGLGDSFEIPVDIATFHDITLVDQPEPALEASLYKTWRERGHAAPARWQCAGYKVPPAMGGRDEVENLVLIDMQVEWQMTGQMLEAVAKMPKGARLDRAAMVD